MAHLENGPLAEVGQHVGIREVGDPVEEVVDDQVIEGFEVHDKDFGFYKEHMGIMGMFSRGMLWSDLWSQRIDLSIVWSIKHVYNLGDSHSEA